LSYPSTDIFLICASVVSPTSFENIAAKWAPEIAHHCPGALVFVVGTKTDLRTDANVLDRLKRMSAEPVTAARGEAIAKQVNAECYIECSSLTGDGLKVQCACECVHARV
jgi:GTPase SAR1 family protein